MLKQAKILLLDFYPSSGLAKTLRGILESDSNPNVHFRRKPGEVCDTTHFNSEMTNTMLDFNPDIIFLLLSSTHMEQIGVLFKSLEKEI